jgi:ubiquinone/menaquinone biosynthesis C-methylase UbiE
MGFWDKWVVPRFLDLMMNNKDIAEERQKCLAGVSGAVLEVGFGSGLNLPFYPDQVEKILAVDPSSEGAKLARKRIAKSRVPVEYVALEGEKIDAPDASFDSVVSTFTLCTIPDPGAALQQVRRVLKPGGRFFFVEHGRSPEPKVQRWQDRLNGLQKSMCGGCNMNRDIERLVREAGFEFDELDKHYMKGAPKMNAFVTRAIARAVA